jgi:peptidoglycan/LPS O-acetylase OafA/YrhL
MLGRNWWRVLLGAIAISGFVGYLLAIFLVDKSLFTIPLRLLGLVLIIALIMGLCFLLPCHPDERMWAHSGWRCYPHPVYHPLRDREGRVELVYC